MLHSKANPELHELDKQRRREAYQKRKHEEAVPGLTRAEAQELIDLQPDQCNRGVDLLGLGLS